jgi:hypothetical protein
MLGFKNLKRDETIIILKTLDLFNDFLDFEVI